MRAFQKTVLGATLAVAGCSNAPRPIDQLRAVDAEGAGNEAASAAVRELSALGPEALTGLLAAMDGASPRACNWLRSAADAVAERALAEGKPLPAAGLKSFVLDSSHAGPARRLAFELLTRVDATAPDRLIPRLLDDPSGELRRDAVERELAAAEAVLAKDGKEAGVAALRRVFAASRDPDQVERLQKKLAELGEAVDLTKHYGFIQKWMVAAPFDNAGARGYSARYPPEVAINFAAELQGKHVPVRWIEHTTGDPLGVVDLNKLIAKEKGVVAYAAAEVEVSERRAVQLRAGTPNAVKIWLNGELLFTRDEYHHGNSIDQYVAPAVLEPGRNRILIKVCQNEQTEDWTESWSFQLRVCDLTGGGIL